MCCEIQQLRSYFAGPSCSKTGERYPVDKLLSSGYKLLTKQTMLYLLNSVIHLLNNLGQ